MIDHIDGEYYKYTPHSEINKERSLKVYIPSLAQDIAQTILYKLGKPWNDSDYKDEIEKLTEEVEKILFYRLRVYYEDSPISSVPNQEMINLISASSIIMSKEESDKNFAKSLGLDSDYKNPLDVYADKFI